MTRAAFIAIVLAFASSEAAAKASRRIQRGPKLWENVPTLDYGDVKMLIEDALTTLREKVIEGVEKISIDWALRNQRDFTGAEWYRIMYNTFSYDSANPLDEKCYIEIVNDIYLGPEISGLGSIGDDYNNPVIMDGPYCFPINIDSFRTKPKLRRHHRTP